jgi:hypothetical protein
MKKIINILFIFLSFSLTAQTFSGNQLNQNYGQKNLININKLVADTLGSFVSGIGTFTSNISAVNGTFTSNVNVTGAVSSAQAVNDAMITSATNIPDSLDVSGGSTYLITHTNSKDTLKNLYRQLSTVVGAKRRMYCNKDSLYFIHSSRFVMPNSANYISKAGDVLEFIQTSITNPQIWKFIGGINAFTGKALFETTISLPQTRVIYVDPQATTAANNSDAGRGNYDKPYLSVEYVLANVVNTGTLTAVTANAGYTLTGVTTNSNIAIGEYLTGTGVPYNTVITAFTSSTIVVSQPMTATGTVTVTWFIPYELRLNGTHTATSNWYKLGFNFGLSQNASVSFAGITLFNINSSLIIPYYNASKARFYGTSASSILLSDITYAHNSESTFEFQFDEYYSVGTGYSFIINNGGTPTLANYKIKGSYLKASAGTIAVTGVTAGRISFEIEKSYGLLGGAIIGNNSTGFIEWKGDITTPTSVNALSGRISEYTGNITGSIDINATGDDGYYQGRGMFIGRVVSALNAYFTNFDIHANVNASSSFQLRGGCVFHGVSYPTQITVTGGYNVLMPSTIYAYNAGLNITGGAVTIGASISLGTLSMSGTSTLIINSPVVNMTECTIGTTSIVEINSDVTVTFNGSFTGLFSNNGKIYLNGGKLRLSRAPAESANTTPTIRMGSSSSLITNGGSIECTNADSKSGLIRPVDGCKVVFKGQPYLKVANGLAPLQILSNTGTAQDIYDFSAIDNCAVGFRLADTFTDVTYGTAYAPNLLIGGTKYEATTNDF